MSKQDSPENAKTWCVWRCRFRAYRVVAVAEADGKKSGLVDQLQRFAEAREGREALEGEVSELKTQVRKLQTVRPLIEVLKNKESEIQLIELRMKELPLDHGGRPQAEEMLNLLIEQRDKIRSLINEAGHQ